MELRGIKAIITGGGSGFGKGIAAALSAFGVKVWITGRIVVQPIIQEIIPM